MRDNGAMREKQARIIAETGVRPTIDPAAEVEARVRFLQEYLAATRAGGFVLGISGGVDSTLAGRLAQLAVEQARAEQGQSVGDEGAPSFIAVRLPYRMQADEADASAAMDFVAADHRLTLDIAPATDGLAAAFAEAVGEPISDYNKGNAKARMRMAAQYAIAGIDGHLVIGTDQAAENVTGFFTKHGDGGADLLPLFGLNKRQVRAVARHLGAPEALWAKVPTADLLDERPGQADEAELGISYEHIDDYLEGREVPRDVAERIEAIHARTRHKRTTPVTPADTWWR